MNDYHIHTNFSFDSSSEVRSVILKAINEGFKKIAITDHYDVYYPNDDFTFNIEEYLGCLKKLQSEFADKIKIVIGVELGMDLMYKDEIHRIIDSNHFEYIIGSVHVINKTDFYYRTFFENKTLNEALNEYFATTLACLDEFKKINTLGHLDAITQYLDDDYRKYNWQDYQEIIDRILLKIIDLNIALEVNLAGYRKGLDDFNPSIEIVRRYFKLGGKKYVLGSDAHTLMDINGKEFKEKAYFIESERIRINNSLKTND